MKRKLISLALAGTAFANPWPIIIAVAVVVPIAVILIVAGLNGRPTLVIPPGARVTLPAVATRPPGVLAGTVTPPAFAAAAVAASPTPPRTLAISRRPDGQIELFVPAFTIVDACLDVNRWFTYQVVCEDTTIVLDPATSPEHLFFRGRSFRP